MSPLAVDRHPAQDDLKRGVYFEGFAPGSDRRSLFTFDYRSKEEGEDTFWFVDARTNYGEGLPVGFSWREVQLGLLLLRRP